MLIFSVYKYESIRIRNYINNFNIEFEFTFGTRHETKIHEINKYLNKFIEMI